MNCEHKYTYVTAPHRFCSDCGEMVIDYDMKYYPVDEHRYIGSTSKVWFVTFGTKYRYESHATLGEYEKWIDGSYRRLNDMYFTVEADDEMQAREFIMGLISDKWGFLYEKRPTRTPYYGGDLLTAVIKADILSSMPDKYYLVYVDRNDELTDGQVELLAQGNLDEVYDEMEDDWLGDSRYISAKEQASSLVDDVLVKWYQRYDESTIDSIKDSLDMQEIMDTICDRDSSEPLEDLVDMTPATLMRINMPFEELIENVSQVTKALGIKKNEENKKVLKAALNEAYRPFLISLVFAVEPSSLLSLGEEVTITNPFVWLHTGSGDGYVTDKPIQAEITVKRKLLHTDKEAPGYGWDETAGVIVNYYMSEIR